MDLLSFVRCKQTSTVKASAIVSLCAKGKTVRVLSLERGEKQTRPTERKREEERERGGGEPSSSLFAWAALRKQSRSGARAKF